MCKQSIILLVLLFPLTTTLSAQSKYDYNWTMGYDTSDFDAVGNVIRMDFNHNPVQVKTYETVKNFFGAGASVAMSDSNGSLIFYTSGCYVVNAQHEIMENGDSINPGYIQQYYCPHGNSPIQDGAIAIPWPDSPDFY